MPLNKGFVLTARPQGAATEDNFRFFEEEVGGLGPDQVLVRDLNSLVDHEVGHGEQVRPRHCERYESLWLHFSKTAVIQQECKLTDHGSTGGKIVIHGAASDTHRFHYPTP